MTGTSEFEDRPELVKKRARALIVQRLAAAALAVFVIASLTLTAYNAIVGIATRAALLDCTTPGGQCYQEGQKRTAEAIRQLVEANEAGEVTTREIVILAADCADNPGVDTADEIEACVGELRQQRGPLAVPPSGGAD